MEEHFRVVVSCPETRARTGELVTAHGKVATPVFLPVASHGTVKALTPDELIDLGVAMLLSNAYHLYLRPGIDIISELGGLHRYMAWGKPMLTDSGGYQIFSLATLTRVDDEGISFRSHIDGSQHFLTPEMVVEIQEKLGSDIIMPLDECAPHTMDKALVARAAKRTHRWAERCLKYHRTRQFLYGIIQGGTFLDLRRESVDFLTSLGLPGYAIGGLSIGEAKELTWETVAETTSLLPENQTRYLMGVGSPEDIINGVALGIDIFDSALPTQIARNGALFTRKGRINIDNAVYKKAERAIDEGCDCYTCRTFSAAYLHHLFRSRELLAYRLATIHNLRFVTRLLEKVRDAVKGGNFAYFKRDFLAGYRVTDEETRLEQKQKWRLNMRTTLPLEESQEA